MLKGEYQFKQHLLLIVFDVTCIILIQLGRLL